MPEASAAADATMTGDGPSREAEAAALADAKGGANDATMDATMMADGAGLDGNGALSTDAHGIDSPVTVPGDGGGIVPGDGGPCTAATVGAACSPAMCVGGAQTLAGTCLANGSCAIPAPMPCSPYICGATSCKTSCASDPDCVSGYACTGGSCVIQKTQGGSPCARDAECQSGLSCSPEGICCNAPCSGACQVCNSAGMCVPVPANQQPRAGHPACTNGGITPCGGLCDGVDIACSYPTTACRIASCGCFPANGCTASPTQNCANGACPDPIYTPCNGFACDPTHTVCNDTCDPSADTGCYGFNCCHTVFTGICLHSCTSTCPASGICN